MTTPLCLTVAKNTSEESAPTPLAEFEVGQRHFRVCESSPVPASETGNVAEVGHFLIDGKDYSIQCCAAAAITPSDTASAALNQLLTARELQIVILASQGFLNKQIAHQLAISEHTVNTHLRRVFTKLGVKNRTAMVFRCAPLLAHLSTTPQGSR